MPHNILAIPALNDNYIWTIVHPQKQAAVIIDPGEAKPVLDFLKQQKLNLAAILVTHHHWDHTNGIQGILTKTSPPPFMDLLKALFRFVITRSLMVRPFLYPTQNLLLMYLQYPVTPSITWLIMQINGCTRGILYLRAAVAEFLKGLPINFITHYRN